MSLLINRNLAYKSKPTSIAFLFLIILNTYSQTFLAPDSQFSPPATPVQASLFTLDVKSSFSITKAHVQDTFSLTYQVSWKNPEVPISVFAPESLRLAGLEIIQVQTKHQKSAGLEAGQPVLLNESYFIYQLRAITPGPASVTAGRLPYISASNPAQPEYYALPSALINVLPALRPWHQSIWAYMFYLVLGIISIGLGIKFYARWSKGKNNLKTPISTLEAELELISARLDIAEGQELLKTLESLASRILAEIYTSSPQESFDRTLAFLSDRIPQQDLVRWQALLQPFNVGRYGAGQLSNHLIREVYSQLKNLYSKNKERT